MHFQFRAYTCLPQAFPHTLFLNEPTQAKNPKIQTLTKKIKQKKIMRMHACKDFESKTPLQPKLKWVELLPMTTK